MAQLGSSLSAETETLSNVLSLVEAFRAFDSDNDGAINAAELGGNPEFAGDGLLSMEEFLEMNTKDMELGELANFLRTAFQAFEVEGDDALTAADLYEVMGNLGIDQLSLEDCQSVIASMDADGDGAVSLEDFRLIINSLF
ncbi:hypothetical protein GOBAR_DD34663 [Gossypium barbadense]|nr:hypothetical protein GOBAR_DD34663 [Gossypium barbadense]